MHISECGVGNGDENGRFEKGKKKNLSVGEKVFTGGVFFDLSMKWLTHKLGGSKHLPNNV